MEFPKPSIDIEAAAHDQFDVLGIGGDHGDDFRDHLKGLLAQAWEEGRWSPPGACLNPYGAPPAPLAITGAEGYVGLRLLHLREAAKASLAWIENMSPTVRRTALANQLRAALGDK